ncbi:unnamed protein product [Staurois parvus]|uniref:Secreted protein n=1 Tax=Staurois parvus TaxID=386267 RepID=A0ABN9AF01_9NEOB|nr:unnamed protein product [Staurois parvus]
MLLPGPVSLSWVPVRPPIAAVSIATHSAMCHFQVSSHCWWVPFCHRVLADYGPPIAAARPVICHGPLYRSSSCCCQAPYGSLYGLPCCSIATLP